MKTHFTRLADLGVPVVDADVHVNELTGGRFVRVYPTRRATFDCGASNTKVLDLDLTNE